MNQHIKVAVIGGTGKAGKYIIKELISQGYSIKMLLKRPHLRAQFEHPQIQFTEGNMADAETARALIKDCTAVISAIGQRQDEPLISALATTNIIAAMKEYGIKRYILITGITMDVPGDTKNTYTQAMTDFMKKSYPEIVADKQRVLDILNNSDIDWTIVRLPVIKQTDERGKLLVDLHDCPGESISTANLAAFLVQQITDTGYIGKAPFVASE
ncbi:SDR family oxidoreductase [Mucilaginibacter gynuensis]|uniref:SDR family oxidoreductase n=1 Tax=Mucilaginibacter gynuensis TaxID=1302236 RepID=A0ABP8G341_9SPHI